METVTTAEVVHVGRRTGRELRVPVDRSVPADFFAREKSGVQTCAAPASGGEASGVRHHSPKAGRFASLTSAADLCYQLRPIIHLVLLLRKLNWPAWIASVVLDAASNVVLRRRLARAAEQFAGAPSASALRSSTTTGGAAGDDDACYRGLSPAVAERIQAWESAEVLSRNILACESAIAKECRRLRDAENAGSGSCRTLRVSACSTVFVSTPR